VKSAAIPVPVWSCVECGRGEGEVRRSRVLARCVACDRLFWRDRKKPTQLLVRLVRTLTNEDFLLDAAERIRASRPAPLAKPYRELVLKAVGALALGEVGTRQEAADRFGLNTANSVPTGKFRCCGCKQRGYHKRRCRFWKPVKFRCSPRKYQPCGCAWRKHRIACPLHGTAIGGAA
jgi:hypothetical protein